MSHVLEHFDFWKLLAGLGLFIFAMQLIESTTHSLIGGRLRHLIRENTDSPLKGVALGTLATSILQSSSIVTLLVMAFVGAGILSLQNALGLIYGSNLGTTLTGWVVTAVGFKVDIQNFAYPLIALGALSRLISGQSEKTQNFLQWLLALGLLFLGLEYMKSSMSALGELLSPQQLAGWPFISYFFFGVAVTALIQSSSATMMITLTALNADLIHLYEAGALIIGADLGTTFTALLGGVGGSSLRKRTALAHFIFNLTTNSLALVLLKPLMGLALYVLGSKEPLFALVLFHSSFNFLGIILFLPWTPKFSRWLSKIY